MRRAIPTRLGLSRAMANLDVTVPKTREWKPYLGMYLGGRRRPRRQRERFVRLHWYSINLKDSNSLVTTMKTKTSTTSCSQTPAIQYPFANEQPNLNLPRHGKICTENKAGLWFCSTFHLGYIPPSTSPTGDTFQKNKLLLSALSVDPIIVSKSVHMLVGPALHFTPSQDIRSRAQWRLVVLVMGREAKQISQWRSTTYQPSQLKSART